MGAHPAPPDFPVKHIQKKKKQKELWLKTSCFFLLMFSSRNHQFPCSQGLKLKLPNVPITILQMPLKGFKNIRTPLQYNTLKKVNLSEFFRKTIQSEAANVLPYIVNCRVSL